MKNILKRFKVNSMKPNPKKFQFINLGKSSRHYHILATEVFKNFADINSDFMKSYFIIKEIPYCSRNGNFLKIPSACPTRYGKNSVLFRACLMWNKLPLSVKQCQSQIEFKSKIKVLKKMVLQNLQFIISW